MATNVPPTPPVTPLSTPFDSTIIEPVTQHQNQHRLVIEQHESATDTMDGSQHSSETGWFGALVKAPDRVAAGGPPSYSSLPNRSSQEAKVVSASSPPPPPPVPCSVPSQTSTSAPLLTGSGIWKADGLYTLPFFGCEGRIFTFRRLSTYAHLRTLDQYEKLRMSAPPERWSDLCGNTLTCGRPTAPDSPQVNIGPVLAGDLSELQDTGEYSYVLILKARCMKSFRDNDGSAHLEGDPIYQWVPFVSLEHAQKGVVESLGLGYSIVGTWAELDVSKVGRKKLMQLAGKKIVVEKRRIFAAVDAASFMGWRERMRLLCSI